MNFTDLIQPAISEDVTPRLIGEEQPTAVVASESTARRDEIPDPAELKGMSLGEKNRVVELLVAKGVPRWALVSATDYAVWRMSEAGKLLLSDARR